LSLTVVCSPTNTVLESPSVTSAIRTLELPAERPGAGQPGQVVTGVGPRLVLAVVGHVMGPAPLGQHGPGLGLHLHRGAAVRRTGVEEHLELSFHEGGVGRVPGGQVEAELPVQVILFKVR
jgi:hypothetical protein